MMFKRFRFFAAAILAAAVLFAGGCETQQNESSHAPKSPAPPAALRMAVVDDPALADSLRKVRGEWRAQSGAELEIQELTAGDVVSAERIDADAVIYPLNLLGSLAERRLIRPLNATWLAGDPLDAKDLLLAADSPEFTWDGQPYAVPLGEPVFVLWYRTDWFAGTGKQPPRSWEEYQALVKFFGDSANRDVAIKRGDVNDSTFLFVGEWGSTVEPLAKGWASSLLLARAAAYAKHRDYFSVLFDRETMKPLIGGPPFVRALTELAAAAKSSSVDLTRLTPSDTVASFLTGHSVMAIGWPKPPPEAGRPVAKSSLSAGSIACVELPGAPAAYNPGHAAWENRAADESARVTLRGLDGRAGSVVRGSDHAAAAFGLLAWMAGKRWSTDILSVSPATAMFRQSQLEEPSAWTGKQLDLAAAKQYGEALQAGLARRETLLVPRLPGAMEYLAALDDTVAAVIKGKTSPQQALDEAAAKWEQITDRFGRQRQLEAYRRSLKGVR